MTIPRINRGHPLFIVGLLVTILAIPFIYSSITSAAALTQVFVRFDRMQISTATTGTVCAKPATTATETIVKVTFPTGYTLGANGTFTTNTTNLAWPTGGTAWPTLGSATVSSQDVSFTSGDLTVGTLYCFNWTSTAAVQIKSSASSSNIGSVTTQSSGPTDVDTASYATASVTGDQISVSASVPSIFIFSLNTGTTDTIGPLSTASVTSSPTPRTARVDTNAKNGWMVWAKDANTGLTSPTASSTIASTTPGSNSTLVAGTAGYNTGITSAQTGGTGSITVAAPFVGSGAGQGGGLDTTLRTLASSGGTADNAVLTIKNNVAIANITPAASDYGDTITVVAAGLF